MEGKAVDYFSKRRNVPLKNLTGISGRISYANAQEIAADIIERHTNEATDEIILAYNEFKSVAAQKAVVTRLLPIMSLEATAETLPVFNFIYEPSKEDISNNLLPKNVEIQVFRALLELRHRKRGCKDVCHGECDKGCQ